MKHRARLRTTLLAAAVVIAGARRARPGRAARRSRPGWRGADRRGPAEGHHRLGARHLGRWAQRGVHDAARRRQRHHRPLSLRRPDLHRAVGGPPLRRRHGDGREQAGPDGPLRRPPGRLVAQRVAAGVPPTAARDRRRGPGDAPARLGLREERRARHPPQGRRPHQCQLEPRLVRRRRARRPRAQVARARRRGAEAVQGAHRGAQSSCTRRRSRSSSGTTWAASTAGAPLAEVDLATGQPRTVLPERKLSSYTVARDGTFITFQEDVTAKTDYDVIGGTENALRMVPMAGGEPGDHRRGEGPEGPDAALV